MSYASLAYHSCAHSSRRRQLRPRWSLGRPSDRLPASSVAHPSAARTGAPLPPDPVACLLHHAHASTSPVPPSVSSRCCSDHFARVRRLVSVSAGSGVPRIDERRPHPRAARGSMERCARDVWDELPSRSGVAVAHKDCAEDDLVAEGSTSQISVCSSLGGRVPKQDFTHHSPIFVDGESPPCHGVAPLAASSCPDGWARGGEECSQAA